MTRIIVVITLFLSIQCLSLLNGYTQEVNMDSKLWKSAMEIHSNATIFDAHAHKLVFSEADKIKYYPGSKQLHAEMLRKGDVDGIGLYFAYYPLKDQTLVARVQEDLNTFRQRIENNIEHHQIISESSDIEQAINKNDLLIVPGVEYFYGTLDGKVSTIDSLYKMGIRVMMLMDNEYEKLSNETEHLKNYRSLNQLAKQSIEKMNELGMLIDITHLDDNMQKKVIEYSVQPVIASHSSVRSVQNIQRNVPDDIISKLAEKGGKIMVTFNSGNLAGIEKGRCEIERLIDHIDHAVEIAGIDHVGLGSDFNGAGLRSPNGLEDPSGFPLITYHLLKRGYTENEIKKIMGENYLELLSSIMSQ